MENCIYRIRNRYRYQLSGNREWNKLDYDYDSDNDSEY